MTDIRWLIVQSFSGAEWQAHCALLRRGFESYYPYSLADSRRGRWSQPVGKPQFPTYLFASVSKDQSFDVVRNSVGVRDVLRQNGEVVMLTDPQLSEIRSGCERALQESHPRRLDWHTWKVGDVVAVPHGPFLGLPVKIDRIDKSGRIEASIGSVVVTFSLSDLGCARPDPSESVRKFAAHGALR